ncbi:MAG: hypothetical protein V2A69_15000, partial [Pseudomonadota bacterium]
LILIVAEENVLCFRADGQVVVEAALNGYRCQFSNTTSQTIFHSLSKRVPLSAKDHCDPCVDIPLSTISLTQHFSASRYSAFKHYLVASACFSGAASPFASIEIEGLLFLPPPEANLTLASLRSVILLI